MIHPPLSDSAIDAQLSAEAKRVQQQLQHHGRPTALPLGYPVDVIVKVMKNQVARYDYTARQQLLQELAQQNTGKYDGLASYPDDVFEAVEEAENLIKDEYPV